MLDPGGELDLGLGGELDRPRRRSGHRQRARAIEERRHGERFPGNGVKQSEINGIFDMYEVWRYFVFECATQCVNTALLTGRSPKGFLGLSLNDRTILSPCVYEIMPHSQCTIMCGNFGESMQVNG